SRNVRSVVERYRADAFFTPLRRSPGRGGNRSGIGRRLRSSGRAGGKRARSVRRGNRGLRQEGLLGVPEEHGSSDCAAAGAPVVSPPPCGGLRAEPASG